MDEKSVRRSGRPNGDWVQGTQDPAIVDVLSTLPTTPLATSYADAFGRAMLVEERDGSLSGAFETTSCDALDLDTGSPHFGTCTIARTDGPSTRCSTSGSRMAPTSTIACG